MPTNKPRTTPAGTGGKKGKTPVGVWNRGTSGARPNPIRVRTRRLDELDSDKIALAYWLLAKRIVANGSGKPITEEEARRVAAGLDEPRGKSGTRAPRQRGRS